MRTVEDLPIMPLSSVLFPGAPRTLYVHEQRYRTMLDEVLEGDRAFGVALLQAGKEVGGPGIPHDIGTIARISEVTDLPDGSRMLLVHGGNRFRVETMRCAVPIVRVDVELLNETPGIEPGEMAAVEAARDRLEQLMKLVLRTMGTDQDPPDFPDEPVELSYAIAANLQITPREQQELLEAESAAERLHATLPILRDEIAHYRVLAAAREKLESLGISARSDDIPFSLS